jgi:hypothetical protein
LELHSLFLEVYRDGLIALQNNQLFSDGHTLMKACSDGPRREYICFESLPEISESEKRVCVVAETGMDIAQHISTSSSFHFLNAKKENLV